MGEVTLRLWTVGDLVVLATSEPEAEDALISLMTHADGTVRSAAARELEKLQGTRAAAA
jgi:hypothetical protein